MSGLGLGGFSSGMECKQRQSKSVKIDERSVKEQEHRKASRLWDKVITKQSLTMIDTGEFDDDPRRGVRFRGASPCVSDSEYKIECPCDTVAPELSGPALLRKMAKMKTFAKRKSPLQKFDEIVTRELTTRQFADDESVCPFEGSQKWSSSLDFSCNKVSTSGRKVSFDTKMSKTTLHNVEKELMNKDKDPSDVENAALMDAIEKLIQAQASCRFDAAVKAAEAAASSVPPDMAEEVAITCAKEYQSQIIDIVNEKVAVGGGRRPMEVIGYIGITKRKGPPDDEE